MKTPRGLVGAALVLWGFSIGIPFAGVALALLVEGARFMPPAPGAQSRVVLVVRIVALLALAKFAYIAVTAPFPQALYTWLRWLPVILVPLPLVQVLAGGALKTPPDDEPLDVSYAYAGVALIGAGTGNAAERWYYLAAAGLVAWAIVANVRARSRATGSALLATAVGIGFAVHVGLSTLQGQVEDWSTELLQDYFAAKPDAFRERTRIGDLGRIKLSDRIMMRVFPEGPRPTSLLLREATFDSYYNGEWRSARGTFQAVPRDGNRWKLRDGVAPRALTMRRSLGSGEGLIALPAGTHMVDRLPAESLEALPTGTVRARGVPRFFAMSVAYDETRESEPPLTPGDLSVPEILAPTLDQVLATDKLRQPSERDTLAAIERFFAGKFSYSLNLGDAKDGRTRTISDFLLREHQGHCEYFATGTVLLLRRAGIPARYTVGYSAQEYSAFESAFIVRNRHAHAWASAYVDGRWIAVDTTPARWAESEGEAARSFFGPAMDFVSWAVERLVAAWLDRAPGELMRDLAIVIALLVVVPLGLLAKRRWRAAARRPRPAHNRVANAWLALERKLARQGFAREHGETALGWARRLRRENQFERWRGELVDLAQAYYRARFDPKAPASFGDDFIRAARSWKNEP